MICKTTTSDSSSLIESHLSFTIISLPLHIFVKYNHVDDSGVVNNILMLEVGGRADYNILALSSV